MLAAATREIDEHHSGNPAALDYSGAGSHSMKRLLFSLALLAGSISSLAQAIHGRGGITLPAPPPTATDPVTDNYFGTKIVDDYRWLEDGKSNDTRAFIDAQNAYTTRYLKQAKIRQQLLDDLDPLVNVTTASEPMQRGESLFFLRRIAGEQQGSIYMRHGYSGKDERLIDPANFSRDPNTSVAMLDVSRDANFVVYGVKQGGADEFVVHIFDIKAKKNLEDELPAARYTGVSFAPEGGAVYYARNNKEGTLLFEHKLGARVAHDVLVFGHEFRGEPLGPSDLFSPKITDDGRYLVLEISRGVPAKREDIVFRDLKKAGSPFDILAWSLDARFTTIEANGNWYVKTDYHSPNGRILKADPGGYMPEAWQTIVPEGQDVISQWSIVGGKLFVNRLKDVNTVTSVYTLAGKPAGTIPHEGLGTATIPRGRTTDRYAFFGFDSFIVPPTIYRLDTMTNRSDVFFRAKVPFNPAEYELKQVFYTSKDGTKVPMFIAGRKGLKQDGTERMLMTGYGGFTVSMTPHWSSEMAWWMAQGGWFAMPNLRGGGEYGEKWHEAAMFEKKQNVFDDWFAAAQYLVDKKYTSPERFAIHGRSNGGLLMGASMVQHPEMFGAIWCGYPLLDMLRYQKFLVGRYWVTEYGSAENEKQFPYLLKYSPYQNVKPGTAYPSIMFFTGDNDTRVDPLHARKMTPLMQAASTSGRPILLHYSTSGGHSSGVSVDQQIQDEADELTFLWTETGPSGRQ
jgi:prolyl oligopeptidase